ncbi:uncharacterized protein A4U43_C10F8540 [Asparagus officinalis]|uniref:Large ribosomal subunit protein uL15/eL18 domain-containing protein n=1 Tax=Asparagus officinalis TaxID=4686 RepID=A0A5P1E1X6_ASPOF|nr:uncharacterized protein A4U43_C10F8540 [Asparagus officinalis]
MRETTRQQLQLGDSEEALFEQDEQASDLSQEACRLHEGKVVVGTVTDDKRVYEVPGDKSDDFEVYRDYEGEDPEGWGECLTFDQLALRAPLRQNTCAPIRLDQGNFVSKLER